MNEKEECGSTSFAAGGARRRGLAMASITVVCWASAFVAIRMAVRSFAPEEVAWLRFCSGAVVLGLMALFTHMPLPRARDLPALAGLGLVGHALYNLALAWGQTRVPAASASFIISFAPIWMLVMSAALRQERLVATRVVAMLVSLAGVALIAVGRGGALVLETPAMVVVAASMMQAVYSMGQRPLLSRYSPLQVSTFTAIAALLWLSPFAPSAVRHLLVAPWSDGLAALFLGVVPTAVGYSTWASAMKNLTPSSAGAFLYLVPVVVLTLAWAVLGELPSRPAIIGGMLVVVGVIVVQRLRDRPRAPAAPARVAADRASLTRS